MDVLVSFVSPTLLRAPTDVWIWVLAVRQSLLKVLKHLSQLAWIRDVSVGLEFGSDFDSVLPPEIATDIPVQSLLEVALVEGLKGVI